MFLANSFDLIELLVKYNIAHLYPQLNGCEFVKKLKAKRELVFEDVVSNWQEQRSRRV